MASGIQYARMDMQTLPSRNFGAPPMVVAESSADLSKMVCWRFALSPVPPITSRTTVSATFVGMEALRSYLEPEGVSESRYI